MIDIVRSFGYVLVVGALLQGGIAFSRYEFWTVMAAITILTYSDEIAAFIAARGR